jgi:glycosyltransferase involved in cell wall biosynthesis
MRAGLLMHRADRVVALTEGAADALSEHYRIPRSRLVVIPKGVSSDVLPTRSTRSVHAARERVGVPQGAVVVLCLGALSPEKNLHLALEAVGRDRDRWLVIAGDGPDRPDLERHAEAAAPGRVRFLGPVSDPSEVLLAADVLLLTSRTEGLPGVAIEAGMVGLPVVATDVGWVRDIVLDGESGVLVPSDDVDAVAAGLDAAIAERERMGARGRHHCLATFDMPLIADRWLRLLDEVRAG